MKRRLAWAILFCSVAAAHAATPLITTEPAIDSPKVLNWPLDTAAGVPDLTEPTANRLYDLHGVFRNCESIDLILSTPGNYHMALRELFQDVLLPNNSEKIQTWYYSTSPPIAPEQIANKTLTFGNLALNCVPEVAVGPKAITDKIIALGAADGPAVPFTRSRGNVILVKKGNPKRIHTVWDLARPNVTVVTPSPTGETGSFNSYRDSLYQIALNDPNPPHGWTAERLFDAVYNSTREPEEKPKWVTGVRIHHREVPWSIAYGKADASIILYHLALHAVRTFPYLYEIVPLGGTVENPMPLPGNLIATQYYIPVRGNWTTRQYDARTALINTLQSAEFTTILKHHGLQRP